MHELKLKHPLGVRAIAARFVRRLPAFTHVSDLFAPRNYRRFGDLCLGIGDQIEETSEMIR